MGGWAALAGILVVGPRLGRYGTDGRATPVPGHHMGYVFAGGFILWFGWFGFNPGSTMAVDPEAISRIALITNLSAASATVMAALYSWVRLGKPDFTFTVNGCLAGLVAITAPCAFVTPSSAVSIGAIAGVLVIEAVLLFDRLKIDDPVGATSVHLVNGIFGTLAVGLFGVKGLSGLANEGLLRGGGATQLWIQAKGVLAVGGFTFFASMVAWSLIKTVMGARASPEEEVSGLDLAEMGMEAYPDAREIEEKVRQEYASIGRAGATHARPLAARGQRLALSARTSGAGAAGSPGSPPAARWSSAGSAPVTGWVKPSVSACRSRRLGGDGLPARRAAGRARRPSRPPGGGPARPGGCGSGGCARSRGGPGRGWPAASGSSTATWVTARCPSPAARVAAAQPVAPVGLQVRLDPARAARARGPPPGTTARPGAA